MPQPPALRIEGARQNNLKNISVEIPHDRLTVVTGVSGSGKSSLAFDTLFAEGQWRYIESLSTYARMFLERIDRPDVDRIEQIRPAVALEQKNPVRTARSTVGTATEIYDYLRLLYAKVGRVHCASCGAPAASHSAATIAETLLAEHAGARALVTFPLPVPAGVPPTEVWAALTRRGFARVRLGAEVVDLAAPPPPTLPGPELDVVLDRVVLAADGRARLVDSLETALREGGGRVAVEIVGGARRAFTEEFRCGACGAALERPQPLLFSFNHPLGACAECKGFGNVLKYDESLVVPDRALSLGGGAIEPWTHPSGKWYQRELVKAARRAGVDLEIPWERLGERARRLVYDGDGKFPGINGFFEEIESYRYKLHVRVFLSRYRTQSPCPVCAGARLKPAALAVKVAGLTIAEFTGLTIERAAATSTAAVVGHDRAFIEAADHVIELGPGSGERGGEVVFSGSQDEFRKTTRSLTARYLTGRESIPAPLTRRPGRRHLVLTGAREHNLKDVTLRLPLGTLTVVTGVSGSGKSTLVHDTLYRAVARAFKTEFQTPGAYTAVTGIEYLKGVRLIDQEPIGRTPRSNPVTYVKAFDEIRKLYAALPRAKALGLGAGAFSFNVPGGRCESCQGDGFQKLEMYFSEDVYVSCQECEGRRYRPEVLGVKHRGKSIADVLALTVDEAVDFFAATPALSRRLRVLQDVGLGYLRLGQPATTLSGGEIVAEGPPEVVAQTAGSYTGKFLAEILPKNGVPKNGRK